MRIGLISDTHGYLDSKLIESLNACDEVWHAGDIGSLELLWELKKHKPVRAVLGNIDNAKELPDVPEDLWFDYEGVRCWITHIAGAPPTYNTRVRQLLSERKPNLLVCGHSHILKVVRDPKYQVMYLNPGACGNQGFHSMKTLLRFSIEKGKLKDMEVVELGKRGALP